MIAFKGRLSFVQYMPAKPIKFGITFFSLNDSTSAYCLEIQVYTGKDIRFSTGEGFVYNIVTFLFNSYLFDNHILYTDNMYTSVKLAHYLRSNSSHLVGTIRKNSRGLPKLKEQRLSRVGDSIKLIDSQGVVVCKWKDKREVYCLSTITDGTDAEVPVSKRTLERKLKPNMILDYNKFMGGVDRHKCVVIMQLVVSLLNGGRHVFMDC